MELFLGWAAFAGAVVLVCIIRSALIGWLHRSRGAATAIAIGTPLMIAAASSALAYVSSDETTGGSGLVGLAVVVFFLIAVVVGALGVALSKLVRREFSLPRD